MAQQISATLGNVTASASSVTLMAANTARIGGTIVNESSAICYVKFGATASATSYTVALGPSDYYELPISAGQSSGVYTGVIDAIWAAANGAARVTEFS